MRLPPHINVFAAIDALPAIAPTVDHDGRPIATVLFGVDAVHVDAAEESGSGKVGGSGGRGDCKLRIKIDAES